MTKMTAKTKAKRDSNARQSSFVGGEVSGILGERAVVAVEVMDEAGVALLPRHQQHLKHRRLRQ